MDRVCAGNPGDGPRTDSRPFPGRFRLARALRCGSGFTLIEVLFSFLILATALTLGSTGIRMSLDYLGRISQRMQAATVLFAVKDIVDEEVQKGALRGKGEHIAGFLYEWETQPLRTARNSLDFGSAEEAVPGSFRVTLNRIRLTLRSKKPPARPFAYEYRLMTHSKVTDASTGS